MNSYQSIVAHYEHCFEQFGDSPKGLDWPNMPDLVKRYDAMLGVIKNPNDPATFLDFGCGTAMLYDHLQSTPLKRVVTYSGLDASSKFIQHCQKKFPALTFYWLDVMQSPDALPPFDYIVMNGVFTEKRTLSFDEMFAYVAKMLSIVFAKARVGVAFNVMSKHVDWERDELFHLPMDLLGSFLTTKLSRNFVIRNDYGLYEYTTYVYK
jgi:hypothetical protein